MGAHTTNTIKFALLGTLGFDLWQVLERLRDDGGGGGSDDDSRRCSSRLLLLADVGRRVSTVFCLLARARSFIALVTKNMRLLTFFFFQLWIFTRDGQIKGDEHLCLSATRTIHTSDEWTVALKECGEYEGEFWTYNPHVSGGCRLDCQHARRRAAAFQHSTFTHRESGLCLDAPLESLNNAAAAVAADGATAIRPPSVQRCGRDVDSQVKKGARFLPLDFKYSAMGNCERRLEAAGCGCRLVVATNSNGRKHSHRIVSHCFDLRHSMRSAL